MGEKNTDQAASEARKTSPLRRPHLACQISIKAFHNVGAAHDALVVLAETCEKQESNPVVLGSLFLSAVVRYCRPFTKTETPLGHSAFPTRSLKKVIGFRVDLHKHLLHLRNRLLAHDDLDELIPPILTKSIQPRGSKIRVPIEVAIANKALAYPAQAKAIIEIRDHIAAAHKGIGMKLNADMKAFRDVCADHQEESDRYFTYEGKMGSEHIPAGGKRVTGGIDISKDPFLVPDEPMFAEMPDGYRYEQVRVVGAFYGPYEVPTEDGGKVVISP